MTTEPTFGDWFVYVLLNDKQIAYTGIAKDVVKRLQQHNAGRGARFTRGRGLWRVIHREGPMSRSDALRREIAIKANPGFKDSLKVADLVTANLAATDRGGTNVLPLKKS